jgi:hypothetical protein
MPKLKGFELLKARGPAESSNLINQRVQVNVFGQLVNSVISALSRANLSFGLSEVLLHLIYWSAHNFSQASIAQYAASLRAYSKYCPLAHFSAGR